VEFLQELKFPHPKILFRPARYLQSKPPGRPNKAGLGVRSSVRTQFFRVKRNFACRWRSMIATKLCHMTRSQVVKVT